MTASPRPEAALLFDLDGTLVDTGEANWLAYRDSLAECGIACPREAFAAHLGRHWHDFLPVLAGSSDPELLRRIHRRKGELYPGRFAALRANAPLVALLRRARPGWGTGLVTTASRANAMAVLRHLGLDAAFDAIVTGDDVARAKPAPDGYLRCLAGLAARVEASLAFEDSATGIAAARAAGLQVMAVQGFAEPEHCKLQG